MKQIVVREPGGARESGLYWCPAHQPRTWPVARHCQSRWSQFHRYSAAIRSTLTCRLLPPGVEGAGLVSALGRCRAVSDRRSSRLGDDSWCRLRPGSDCACRSSGFRVRRDRRARRPLYCCMALRPMPLRSPSIRSRPVIRYLFTRRQKACGSIAHTEGSSAGCRRNSHGFDALEG